MYDYLYPIVLASASPRRKQLMEWACIPFTIEVSDVNELVPDKLPAEEVPVHIALQKAQAIKALQQQRAAIIVAADTVVVAGDTILGKPHDRDEALQMLQKLSGKRHTVITGVVVNAPDKEYRFAESTSVFFNELTAEELAFYVDRFQPYDKAGAYAIQEWIGAVGIERVEGDFYNVMGLPVQQLYKVLQPYRKTTA